MFSIHICCTLFLAQHPTNTKVCEGSNAVLNCVVFDNSTNNAADYTSWFTDSNPPAQVSSNMINNTRDGDVVTSVLTIESVSLSDNGDGYFCSPVFGIGSYVGVILVAGENEQSYVFMYLCVHTFIMSVIIIIHVLYLEPNCQAAITIK